MKIEDKGILEYVGLALIGSSGEEEVVNSRVYNTGNLNDILSSIKDETNVSGILKGIYKRPENVTLLSNATLSLTTF
jgi:hypothetical protein